METQRYTFCSFISTQSHVYAVVESDLRRVVVYLVVADVPSQKRADLLARSASDSMAGIAGLF